MLFLPGTVLQTDNISLGFGNLAPSLMTTKGLTLSQVCSVTGLEPSTIQNWIKRGWVAHPENKRYGEYQLARILIINMLRASMQLDSIAYLLRYVNGEADDRGDDSIPDSVLYTHLCVIVQRCKADELTRPDDVKGVVTEALSDYEEVYPGAKKKLTEALTVMTLAFVASEIKKDAEQLFAQLQA